ncbi:hypothetical protein ACVWY3_004573 [Bradyrhizobium sp. USDA 4486]
MGQVLHGCATNGGSASSNTKSQESLRGLAKRYGINQKTVAKWKQRETVADRSTGPKEAKSTIAHSTWRLKPPECHTLFIAAALMEFQDGRMRAPVR